MTTNSKDAAIQALSADKGHGSKERRETKMRKPGRPGLVCHVLLGGARRMFWAAHCAFAQEAPVEDGSDPASAGPPIDLPSWLQHEVVGIAMWQFVAAFLFVLAGLVAKKISDYLFETKIIPLLRKTPFAMDNLLATAASKPVGMLLLLGGIAGACGVLPLPEPGPSDLDAPNVRGFVTGVLAMLLAADIVWFLFRVIDVAVEYLAKLALRTESKLDDQLVPMIRKALKITVGVVCGVCVSQLLGYSVSSLLAGLGIGGLAVALALQDALANFFGSVALYIDRPFIVGDLIRMDGDVEGFVEQIGFRSTRLRTWPGTMVVVPNKMLSNAVIDNWTRMPKRRVMHSVGLTYETTADQMEAAVAGIRSIIENDDGIDKEFIVVRFTEFADSSLNILVFYYTVALDMPGHNETKERINLAIMRLVAEMGLSIAFPTRTVYFEGDIAKGMAAPGGGEAKS